ncbi:MAG TPA: MFS transporter [Ilumatobacter sp.]|nr:MFS transporter [Ilumatobacter sp.]
MVNPRRGGSASGVTVDTPESAPAEAPPAGHPRRWLILAVLCSSLTLVMVSNMSLNVALPSIADDLDASSSQLQWIVDAYALVFAGLLFAAATLGDRFGRKGALQLGLVLFVVAAVIGAFVDSAGALIAVRAVMGLGAAFVMPSTLSILIDVFPPHERPKAIAMWAGISAGGAALGPPISGFLLEHFWWGSVLLITLPISAFALVAGHVLVPTSRDPNGTKVDLAGVALSILAIGMLVYTIIEAPHQGWGSARTLGGFAVAIVAVVVFVAVERRKRAPMLDIGLFSNPRFSVASIGIGMAFFAMFGTFFLLTQVFQFVHGQKPLSAGLMVLPVSFTMMLVAPRAATLAARFGTRTMVPAGLTVVAVALVLFGWMAQLGSPFYMWISGIPLSVGMALTMTPLTALIMSAVPPARAGMGSAMNDATRELGGALGVAVLGSAAATVYAHGLDDTFGLTPEQTAMTRSGLAGALRTASQLSGPQAAALANDATEAFRDGVFVAALVAAAIAATAALIARLWLPRQELQHGAGGHGH